MLDPFAIQTSGEAVLSKEGAKQFAFSIYASMKAYIKEHQEEYNAWLAEQKGDESNE